MNAADYGQQLRYLAGVDLSAFTSLTFDLLDPLGVASERVALLGTTPVTDPGTSDVWPANYWAYYQFVNGDVSATQFGLWQARLVYMDSGALYHGDYKTFFVGT